MRRFALACTIVVLLALTAACSGGSSEGTISPERPNVLLVVTDDQRYDSLGEFMPEVQSRIFDSGTTFENAYATTPLCCPSRASILTGMYAHKHLVKNNETSLMQTTLVHRLHDAGYYTGMVGKYLNSWDGSPRPEFDFWVGLSPVTPDQYFHSDINVNGTWTRFPYYTTRVLERFATGFVSEALTRENPFLLLFWPNAPHGPATPAPDYQGLYADLPPYRPPNYNEEDVSDKPAWLQNMPSLSDDQQQDLDNARDALRLRQLRSLKSVDDAVGTLLDQLDEHGELEDTVVIYMSDNGIFLGEHGLDGKEVVYDSAIHIPLAIRYPRAFPEKRIEGALVANIDIAPTIYELTGLRAPSEVDGRSLVSLVKDKNSWREALIIEGWAPAVHYVAVRTEHFIYVENQDDIAELYDLNRDPHQMENIAGRSDAEDVMADLRARMAGLLPTPAPLPTRPP